jgi:hypothetical protein
MPETFIIDQRRTEDLLVDRPGTIVEGKEAGEFWRCGVVVRADDVVLRNLTFRQSPRTAVIIEGAANVAVESCRFFACGYDGGTVTVWLGQDTSGGRVNCCEFDLLGLRGRQHRRASHVHSIAVMTAQNRCTGHRLEGNTIRHYDYGMQLGATGTCLEVGGHTVRGNRVVCPRTDGIHVKQARCLVEGNTVIGSSNVSISARAGFGTRFLGNTIEDGYLGIIIRGRRHEVRENRFSRVRAVPILLASAKPNGDGFAAEETLLGGNTFQDCGHVDAGRPTITYTPIAGEPFPPTETVLEGRETG